MSWGQGCSYFVVKPHPFWSNSTPLWPTPLRTWQLPSDYALLIIKLEICEEISRSTKCALKQDSNKEKEFTNAIITRMKCYEHQVGLQLLSAMVW